MPSTPSLTHTLTPASITQGPPSSPAHPHAHPCPHLPPPPPAHALNPAGVEDAYMTYEVSVATSLPLYREQQFSVRRRFKDFVALSKLLPRLYPGAFIPGRPKRNAVEGRRMSPAFVEARRAGLERYLNRLAAHEMVGNSEVCVWGGGDGVWREYVGGCGVLSLLWWWWYWCGCGIVLVLPVVSRSSACMCCRARAMPLPMLPLLPLQPSTDTTLLPRPLYLSHRSCRCSWRPAVSCAAATSGTSSTRPPPPCWTAPRAL